MIYIKERFFDILIKMKENRYFWSEECPLDPTPLTDPKTDEEMNASMTCKFGHGPKPEQEFESREAFNVLEDDIGYEVISGEKIPLNDEELKAFDVEGIPHFDNKGGIPHFDDNDAVVDFIFRLRATIRQRSQAAADYRRAVPLLDESGKINWPSVHDNPTILRDMLSQRDKELEETEDQLEVTLKCLKKISNLYFDRKPEMSDDTVRVGKPFVYIPESDKVTRGENSTYTIHNFITAEGSPHVSMAVSELNGELPYTKNVNSDRVYYFLEAKAQAEFVSGEVVDLETGSALYIKAGTEYMINGDFRAVIVNTPAFRLRDEVPRAKKEGALAIN